MIIEFECDSCGTLVKAPAKYAGHSTKCPKCDEPITVPDDAGEGRDTHTDSAEAAPAGRPERHRRRTPAAHRRSAPEPVTSESAPRALGAAIAAAAAGAALWAAIAFYTDYEVGWVAWGIGGMIGGACIALGGRGQNLAVTCAVLAVVSIAVGKLAAAHFTIDGVLRREAATALTQEHYDKARSNWTEYAELPDSPTDEQLQTFMTEHDIDETVAEFRTAVAPLLEAMAEANPTLDQWRNSYVEAVKADISLVEVVTQNLSAFDLLFVFLGVSTAFGLVMKATSQDAAVARAEAREARRSEPESESESS